MYKAHFPKSNVQQTRYTMINTFLLKIKDYEEKVITGDILAETPGCPLCSSTGSNLSIHERRSRHIYIIDHGEVIDQLTLQARLKCAVCERTFTHHPDFIAPHKRYIVATGSRVYQKPA